MRIEEVVDREVVRVGPHESRDQTMRRTAYTIDQEIEQYRNALAELESAARAAAARANDGFPAVYHIESIGQKARDVDELRTALRASVDSFIRMFPMAFGREFAEALRDTVQ